MTRLHTRRIAAAVLGAAVLFGTVACSSDSETPDSARPSASTSAATSPSASGTSAATETLPPGTVIDGADPLAATDPAQVAQFFTEAALGNKDSLNGTAQDAVTNASAYLTENLATELVNGADADPTGTFRVLPFRVPNFLPDGQYVTSTDVTVTSVAVLDTTATYTLVQVVADFQWTVGDQGSSGSTRTYTLTMVPGTDPTGMQWLVNGIQGTDLDFTSLPPQ